MIHAVLFDMDGVIFNSERLYARVLPEIAKEFGYDMDRAFFVRTLGIPNPECRRLYVETYGPEYPFEETSKRLKEFILSYNQKHTMPLKPGVMDCLRSLRERGFTIILATSSPRVVVEPIFAALPQLNALFHGKVCGDEVTRGKPAPEIYQKAAALAGFPPAECLGVEDAPSGLQSIRRSGAVSVMIPDLLPYGPDLEPFTDHVLSTISELPDLIDRLNER